MQPWQVHLSGLFTTNIAVTIDNANTLYNVSLLQPSCAKPEKFKMPKNVNLFGIWQNYQIYEISAHLKNNWSYLLPCCKWSKGAYRAVLSFATKIAVTFDKVNTPYNVSLLQPSSAKPEKFKTSKNVNLFGIWQNYQIYVIFAYIKNNWSYLLPCRKWNKGEYRAVLSFVKNIALTINYVNTPYNVSLLQPRSAKPEKFKIPKNLNLLWIRQNYQSMYFLLISKTIGPICSCQYSNYTYLAFCRQHCCNYRQCKHTL